MVSIGVKSFYVVERDGLLGIGSISHIVNSEGDHIVIGKFWGLENHFHLQLIGSR